MKIGLSTLYLISQPFNYMVKKLPKLNTNFIELIDDGLHVLNKRRVKLLKEVASSCSLEFSVHAPFADINIAALSHPIRKAILKRLEKSLQFADQLEAKLWVFHPGTKTGLSYFYPEEEWKTNIASTKYLSKIADELDVPIAIENLPEPYPLLMKNVDDFFRFYSEIKSSEVGLALDIGHANLNGQIELFLKLFHDKIVHMHVSDNDGKNDLHLGIGEGAINWEKVAEKIKEIGFNGSIVVESVQNAEKSLDRLREILS